MKNILVTGGAGFVGSHVCKILRENNFNPITFDNLSEGNKNLIKHVKDRPFNDTRYSISSNRIKKLGWKTKYNLFKQLPEMILWYKKNQKLFK